jgi:hypothetical protein
MNVVNGDGDQDDVPVREALQADIIKLSLTFPQTDKDAVNLWGQVDNQQATCAWSRGTPNPSQ